MKADLFLTFCVFAWTMHAAQAQPIKERDDASRSESPYFLVKCPSPVQAQVALQSTQVDAQVDGVIADVTVRQTYVNNGRQTLEAIYVFPGSTRAAVYGLDMRIGKRLIPAKVKERDAARKEYNQAKKAGKTASLLEQHRPNVFQMNVANILPGDTIAVTMHYTELLEHHDGIYEFVYPGAVGPRYDTGGEAWVERSIGQLKQSPSDFNICATIKAGVPVQYIKSPSHQTVINRLDAKNTAVSLANPRDKQGNRDFILQYGLQGNQVQSGMMCYNHGDEKFFLLMVQPPKATPVESIPPREYIFIVDVSGSMHGFPIEVSKTILRQLISSLRPTDIFNVLLFESSRAMLSDKSMPATPENINKAINVIDRQPGSGGTVLYPALQTAFDFPTTPEFARTFVIATDGYVTVENKAFKLVRERRDKANLFALGIGGNVNRHLIEGLAYAGAGEAYFINNKTEAETVGKKLITDIATPVLSHIQIDWGIFAAYDVEPVPVADLFAAKPVIVYGKYRGNTMGNITVKGNTATGEFKQTIQASNAEVTKSEALRYLWARNRIKYLSDYACYFDDGVTYYYKAETQKYQKQITDLGLKYNLLTKYTSFLAVDDQVRKEENTLDLEIVNNEVSVDVMEFNSPIIEEECEEAEVFTIVEDMPLFNGGVAEDTFRKWIAENIKFPQECIDLNIMGKVFVKFTIDRNGNVIDVKVIRGIHPAMDAEAVRVISSSPKWIPARQRGKPVNVTYTFPVTFKLEKPLDMK